jgi:hypothetical protein
MSNGFTNHYPFTARGQNGKHASVYAKDIVSAAKQGQLRLGVPIVLVVRADEPWVRPRPSWVSRLLTWVGK